MQYFHHTRQLNAGQTWFKHTDESGHCWRIQTTVALAEIGGLLPAYSKELHALPKYITPRNVWLRSGRVPKIDCLRGKSDYRA